MMNDLEYIIALLAQTNQASASYSLENLELEYETISNNQLVEEISSMFSLGRSISYEPVTMFQKISWPKASTI